MTETIKLRAIALYQPHAWLTAMGYRRFIIRPFYNEHRGLFVICSTRRARNTIGECDRLRPFYPALPSALLLPYQAAVAVARLADCRSITDNLIAAQTDAERACGDWQRGHYAWEVADVQLLEPTLVRCFSRFWHLELDRALLPDPLPGLAEEERPTKPPVLAEEE